MLVGAGNAQGMEEEAGRPGLCPQPAWRGSHRAACAFLAPLSPYGSRWRLVAPPGRPETAASALGGGESNYRQPCTRPAQTSSLYSWAWLRAAGWGEPSRSSSGEVSGGGTVSCRMCCHPGSSEEFVGFVMEATLRGVTCADLIEERNPK